MSWCYLGGYHFFTGVPTYDRLVGLVAKASTSGAEDLEFDSSLRSGDFSGLSHTSGYPARRLALDRVGAGADWPGVSKL